MYNMTKQKKKYEITTYFIRIEIKIITLVRTLLLNESACNIVRNRKKLDLTLKYHFTKTNKDKYLYLYYSYRTVLKLSTLASTMDNFGRYYNNPGQIKIF